MARKRPDSAKNGKTPKKPAGSAAPRTAATKPSPKGRSGGRGPVLVTGASGFLGRHVVEALGAAGYGPITALQRRATTLLDRLGARQIEGSVLDGATLARAARGCCAIINLAGTVQRRLGGGDQEMFDVHVEGTRGVLAAAAEVGARVVHVSSSGTRAVSKKPEVITEEHPFAIRIIRRWPYYLSKMFAEKVALEAASAGQDVVIASPTLLLGPGDEDLSSTQDVLRLLKGDVAVIPPGGVSFVDVRDAAAAIVAAIDRGRAGETYLLGAENLDFKAFFDRLARVSGARAPKVRVSKGRLGMATRALSFVEKTFGLPGEEAASVDMASYCWYLDSSKAKDALGFAPRPGEQTLRDTVEWLLAHPHLKPSRGILGAAARGFRLGAP